MYPCTVLVLVPVLKIKIFRINFKIFRLLYRIYYKKNISTVHASNKCTIYSRVGFPYWYSSSTCILIEPQDQREKRLYLVYSTCIPGITCNVRMKEKKEKERRKEKTRRKEKIDSLLKGV